MKKGILKGKKTYITAVLTLIAAICSYMVDDTVLGFHFSTLSDLVEFCVLPILAIFIRNGIEP